MSLTSNDETDLLLPLYRGVHETPRFGVFLDRLKRRTGAEYVSIATRRNGSPMAEAEVYYSGINLHQKALSLNAEAQASFDAEFQPQLRPFRVYSASDSMDHDAQYRTQLAQQIEPMGISDQRIVRIPVSDGISGWLVLARDKDCSAADGALLSNLAPYVETALKTLHSMERGRIEAEISADGLTRSGTGWILFDASARIVAIEPATQNRLNDVMGAMVQPGDRLLMRNIDDEKKLSEAALRFSQSNRTEAGHTVISDKPRIDALLVSSNQSSQWAMRFPSAVMTAYCRFESSGTAERTNQLAGIFDLPKREAELAIALSDGLSISEAARAMGLTLETARNYSKRLYSKLSVSGQAYLVRLVHQSSAVLA